MKELAIFVGALNGAGVIRLANATRPSQEIEPLLPILRDLHKQAELAFPGAAPPLHPEAAAWAFATLYRACQCMVFRAIDEATILSDLCAYGGSEPDSAAAAFSVDLAFQHLPEIYRLAKAASVNDPLVAKLETLAVQWPLSAVGVAGIACDLPEYLANHSGMRQYFTDRIIARGDYDRLNHPALIRCARQALGAYPDLDLQLHQYLQDQP